VPKVSARANFRQEVGWELAQGERVELGGAVETRKITPRTHEISLDHDAAL
jgi:hypothetical protein